ncbi:MAG: hypothetical protein MK212_19885, partial [Saprospiraceae bacterium]|nr:hypothetical protein [Saprospiraceae bacterium]
SLCTDGLFSLEQFNDKVYPVLQSTEVLDFILHRHLDNVRLDYQLQAKFIQLEQNWGLKPNDDLAIIQLLF